MNDRIEKRLVGTLDGYPESFGSDSFYFATYNRYQYLAKTNVRCFTINRKEFKKVLSFYPQIKKKYQSDVVTKYGHTKDANKLTKESTILAGLLFCVFIFILFLFAFFL